MDGPTLTLFLVQISLVLAVPLVMAKLLQKLALSALVVELLCGVILGPSVLGTFAPALYARVFPALGRATQAREAVTELGLLMFVFMAGLELQPKRLRSLGMPILWTSLFGILLPLALGVGSVFLWPGFWRNQAQSNLPLLALFVGTILSISALPVIARILMDLNLIKTELGTIVMSAAMLDDLVGWGLFAVILSNFGGEGHTGRNLWASLVMVLLVFGLILNLSNPRIQQAVGWLNLPKETLQLKLTFLVVMTAAIFSEVLGTHATLGAFLAGVALGRIPDARKLAHQSFYRTTASIFATMYFVSIGLKVNFVANFDLLLRNRRLGQHGAVGIEAVEARVLQQPLVGRKLGAIGENDLARPIAAIVLDQRNVQQRQRIRFVGGCDGELAATARERRRHGKVAAERARVIDHRALDLHQLVVGVRNECFLEVERRERHHDAHGQQRRHDTRKRNTRSFHGRQFAVA